MRAGDLVADRYQLEGRIDGGAMGDVWRGLDTRLNRPVAIKLLHSGLSENPRFRTRFQQEARSVAALQAPGVVGLYDYGEDTTPDGVLSFLVMELVRGKSLSGVLAEEGPMDPRRLLPIIADAADALQAAHEAGIVHRDVKPANMLLSDSGRIKLVDFGIARARGEAGLTETGMVMGTVAYSSPEQLYDKDLTGLADVYSLGIVAYECLSGAPPFGSTNPGAVINGHLHQEPPPLPQHIPQPVVDIVECALQKDPARRFQSAAEFAQACRDVLAGNAPTVRMAGPAEPTRPMNEATQRMGAPGPPPPPPPRRPAPPPTTSSQRIPEPPKKAGKTIGIIAAILVALLLIIVVATTLPWTGDDKPAAGDSSQTATDTENDETGDSDEDNQDDDGGGNDNGNDGGGNNGGDNGNDGGGNDDGGDEQPNEPEDPPMVAIPNVLDNPLPQAQKKLEDKGFSSQATYDNDENGDCSVSEQSPGAGQQADPEETDVKLTVRGTEQQCAA